MNKAKKPIPTSFYQNQSYTSVFYTCPHCKKIEFRFMEENEKFCHDCGGAIDWRVVTQLLGGLDSEAFEQVRKDPLAINIINNLNEKVGTSGELYRPSALTAEHFKEIYNELKQKV